MSSGHPLAAKQTYRHSVSLNWSSLCPLPTTSHLSLPIFVSPPSLFHPFYQLFLTSTTVNWKLSSLLIVFFSLFHVARDSSLLSLGS